MNDKFTQKTINILMRITDEQVPLFGSDCLVTLHKDCRELLAEIIRSEEMKRARKLPADIPDFTIDDLALSDISDEKKSGLIRLDLSLRLKNEFNRVALAQGMTTAYLLRKIMLAEIVRYDTQENTSGDK